jgi:hypothetical protein
MIMMTAVSSRIAISKESKQQWSLKHPPQRTARAVRVHVMFTLLLFALATAYRLPCEQEASGGEPVGWQRWRRPLLEQTRDHVIVYAAGCYGIFHLAEYSLLLGVNIKDRPPGIGTHPQILAKYGLTEQRCAYIGISEKTNGIFCTGASGARSPQCHPPAVPPRLWCARAPGQGLARRRTAPWG